MRSIVLSDVVSQMVHYFSEDFDIEQWLETAPCFPTPSTALSGEESESSKEQSEQWSSFFRTHESGWE